MMQTKLPSNVDPTPIDDPLVLWRLANQGKAVYVSTWKRHSPAAFIVSMQFRIVIMWMNYNRFYKFKKDNE